MLFYLLANAETNLYYP